MEHKTIYEEYVHLMEGAIDAELKTTAGYEADQVDAFYQTFKGNVKFFEEENADVVDTLFGMVDFMKFKQSMVNYKKGMKNEPGTD